MPLCDLALCALTYPEATSDLALSAGVALAKRLQGRLALLEVTVKIPAPRSGVAQELNAYAARERPDLLVMGAYGHSYIREIVLGGATADLMDARPCPVLISH